MFKIESTSDRIVHLGFNPHCPGELAPWGSRSLLSSDTHLEGVETRRISERVLNPEIVAIAPEVKWINLLQIDSFIPPFLAILLKHCGSDRKSFKAITKQILDEQKDLGVLTPAWYQVLLQFLASGKYETVYKYLYAAAINYRTENGKPTRDVITDLNGKWFYQINGAMDQLRLSYVRVQVEAWLNDVQG